MILLSFLLSGVFVPNQKMYFAVYVFSQKVATVFVVDELETVIIFRGKVVVGCGYGKLASLFGEKANSCVFKSVYTNSSSVTCVYGRSLSAGDKSVCLFDEYTAFPLLSSAESVQGFSVFHLSLATDKYWGTERESEFYGSGGV